MKELSIEEKAKAYDEAIKVIKDNLDALNEIHETGANVVNIQSIRNCFYRAFPELKESEGEQIRKALLRFHKSTIDIDGIKGEDILAWLEKQGEQKPVNITGISSKHADGKLGEMIENMESANKVEPKFHEGEWVVSNLDGKARQISEVHFDEYNSYYVVDGESANLEEYDRLHHLWTIQDAKDGDVLTDHCDDYKNPLIFILKKFETVDFGLAQKSDYSSYCFLSMSDRPRFKEGYFHHIKDVKPATKEQRDTLMKAMADAGYTFDFEKKELKKIEQKPAWSEEDERIYKSIIYSFAHNYPLTIQQQEFVKSLKDNRVICEANCTTIKEWSEEDEINRDLVYNALNQVYDMAHNKDLSTWINKRILLCSQQQWKPSDKQLNNILDVLSFDNCTPKRRKLLESLYRDLKKLREE